MALAKDYANIELNQRDFKMLKFNFGLSTLARQKNDSNKYKVGNKLFQAKKINPKTDPSIKVK